MIVNGIEVNARKLYNQAQKTQEKVNKVQTLPDDSKQTAIKKDLSDTKIFSDIEQGGYNEQSSNSGSAPWGFSNTSVLTGRNSKLPREEYYNIYEEMAEHNFLHRGLCVIADDATQKNDDGRRVKVLSDNDEVKDILESLFYKRLNIDKEIWSWVYTMCKMGDCFLEIIPDNYSHPTKIIRLRFLESNRVNRIEKEGRLLFYTYLQDNSDTETAFEFGNSTIGDSRQNENQVLIKLEPWQIVHFRIEDVNTKPYGASVMASGIQSFKRLQLLEDAIVIYRLARVPDRKVFKIYTGNLPRDVAERQIQKIRDNYRSSNIIDQNGNINRTASALSITQDYFIPIPEGGQGTDVTSLGAGTALNNIDDIKYFRDEILWTMNIPPEILGSTSDQNGNGGGRGSLAMQDIKFARYIERIQAYIEEGLIKVASEELFFNGRKSSEINDFNICLTNPSNVKEVMDIEYLNQKIQLISSMLSIQANGSSLFSKRYVLKKVLRLTDKEVNDIINSAQEELLGTQGYGQMASNGTGGAGMGMALGGAPGGADLAGGLGASAGGMGQDANSMNGMANGISATPQMNTAGMNGQQMSINTENAPEVLLNIFGRDVLLENKKDFVKVVKAVDDYETRKNIIVEEVKEDESQFSKDLTKLFNNDSMNEENHYNDDASVLLYENEFGGLDFDSFSFSVYKQSNSKKLLKEEITSSLS